MDIGYYSTVDVLCSYYRLPSVLIISSKKKFTTITMLFRLTATTYTPAHYNIRSTDAEATAPPLLPTQPIKPYLTRTVNYTIYLYFTCLNIPYIEI